MAKSKIQSSKKSKRTEKAIRAEVERRSNGTETIAKSPAAVSTVVQAIGHIPRVSKHDRVLTLLTRPDGATIKEMMDATNWQQHSVRGFLAGTVKKKLGQTLTSSKESSGPRRYRIENNRGD